MYTHADAQLIMPAWLYARPVFFGSNIRIQGKILSGEDGWISNKRWLVCSGVV